MLSLETKVILSGLGFCQEWWGKESWALEYSLPSEVHSGRAFIEHIVREGSEHGFLRIAVNLATASPYELKDG